MNDQGVTCPCGQPIKHWELTVHDQRNHTFTTADFPGRNLPAFMDHPDGTRHLVQGGRVVG